MNKYGRAALLALLILASLGLHALTAAQPLWLDEAISARQATGSIADTISRVADDVHTPLYHVLLNAWTDLVGTEPWQIRSLSIIFHALTIYAVYRLGSDYYTETSAWITTSLIAVTEATIHYGQEARPYSLLILLSILSAYTYLSYQDNPTWYYAALYAAINTLLLYTHIFGALLILAHIAHHLLQHNGTWEHLDTKLTTSYVSTGILFLPWLPVLTEQLRGNSLTWLPTPGITYIFSSYGVLLGSPLAVILIAGLITKNPPRKPLLTLWATLPPIALIAASFLVKPAFHHRYILFTLPAIYLITAASIEQLRKPFKTAMIVLIIVLAATSSFYPDNHERDEWDLIADHLGDNRPETEPLLIHPNYHQDPLTKTYNEACFQSPFIYSCNAETKNIYALSNDASCCDNTTSLLRSNKSLDKVTNTPFWVLDVRQPQNTHDKPLIDHVNTSYNLDLKASFSDGIALYRATTT